MKTLKHWTYENLSVGSVRGKNPLTAIFVWVIAVMIYLSFIIFVI